MLKIHTCEVTPFQQNCRLLIDTESNASVLVDPGGDIDDVWIVVTESGANLQAIALTHSHIDHCAGVKACLEKQSDLVLYGHEIEANMRAGIAEQAMMFGLSASDYQNCPEPTTYLAHGDHLPVGTLEAVALFTPGHSPGHLSFYFENVAYEMEEGAGSGPLLIAGDALFNGSIGRTDLPGGNHSQLLESIKTQLLTLPDETVVLCGHGPNTTIGAERQSNPFLRG